VKGRSKTGFYRVTRGGVALAVLLCGMAAIVLLTGLAGEAVRVAARPAKHPIYSVETPEKKVALGINCAWDNGDIGQILEVLEQHNVKASFFLVGDWCDRYPDSVRQIDGAGHELGSHSDTHADMTKLDREGILREIRSSKEKIKNLTGKTPTLFRPPSGAYNNQVIEQIEAEGLFPIQWDCDSLDYRNLTPDEMQQRIFKKLRNGSILLFHSGAKYTPQALPQIIEAIRAEGYEFVMVSELIHPRPYRVDFEGRQHPVEQPKED
jgi:polysaccharide deacetylase family sporulation protein PdaB